MARPSSPTTAHIRAGDAFARLLAIMAGLRNPDGGCPWDLEQDFDTIAPYTIEEAYEVADAIARREMDDLRDELGDLLFQVAFHSQMASEHGDFDACDVAEAIADKMLRRHPHVFKAPDGRDAEGQSLAWEEMKAAERAAKNEQPSALEGVAKALPALMRAEKLQKRAARTGFDWASPGPVFDKLDEEIGEVRDAIASNDRAAIQEELGDLLFVCANLARQLEIDPETALRKANDKFERRFRAMEQLTSGRGQVFSELTLDQQESLWTAVKALEKQAG